jgi:hypothetical protein
MHCLLLLTVKQATKHALPRLRDELGASLSLFFKHWTLPAMGSLEGAPVFAWGPEQVPHSDVHSVWLWVTRKGKVSLQHTFCPRTSYSCKPASARSGALCSGQQLLTQSLPAVPSYTLSSDNSSLEQIRHRTGLQKHHVASCVCVVSCHCTATFDRNTVWTLVTKHSP